MVPVINNKRNDRYWKVIKTYPTIRLEQTTQTIIYKSMTIKSVAQTTARLAKTVFAVKSLFSAQKRNSGYDRNMQIQNCIMRTRVISVDKIVREETG